MKTKPTKPVLKKDQEKRVNVCDGESIQSLVDQAPPHAHIDLSYDIGYYDAVEVNCYLVWYEDETLYQYDQRVREYQVRLAEWEAWYKEHESEIEERERKEKEKELKKLEKQKKDLEKKLAAINKKVDNG